MAIRHSVKHNDTKLPPTKVGGGLPHIKLPAHRFQYENWIGTRGYNTFRVWDVQDDKPQPGWRLLGWCEAHRISVRPQESGFVVLFEKVYLTDEDRLWHVDDVGETVWFHVDRLPPENFEEIPDSSG
jgi:hypothetical protein